jgi:hypothetical protein
VCAVRAHTDISDFSVPKLFRPTFIENSVMQFDTHESDSIEAANADAPMSVYASRMCEHLLTDASNNYCTDCERGAEYYNVQHDHNLMIYEAVHADVTVRLGQCQLM